MCKVAKLILIGVGFIGLSLASLVIYGLYLMDIEDRYGDLQQLYHNSEPGDLIINNLNGKVGLVEFKDRRIYVNTGKEVLDIDEWLDPYAKYIVNTDVYRPNSEAKNYLKPTISDIENRINAKELVLVSHLEYKY